MPVTRDFILFQCWPFTATRCNIFLIYNFYVLTIYYFNPNRSPNLSKLAKMYEIRPTVERHYNLINYDKVDLKHQLGISRKSRRREGEGPSLLL